MKVLFENLCGERSGWCELPDTPAPQLPWVCKALLLLRRVAALGAQDLSSPGTLSLTLRKFFLPHWNTLPSCSNTPPFPFVPVFIMLNRTRLRIGLDQKSSLGWAQHWVQGFPFGNANEEVCHIQPCRSSPLTYGNSANGTILEHDKGSIVGVWEWVLILPSTLVAVKPWAISGIRSMGFVRWGRNIHLLE